MVEIISFVDKVNIPLFRLVWLCYSVFTILLLAKLNNFPNPELKHQNFFKEIYYKFNYITEDYFAYNKLSLTRVKILTSFILLIGWIFFAISIVYILQPTQHNEIYTISEKTVLGYICVISGLIIGLYHFLAVYFFLSP